MKKLNSAVGVLVLAVAAFLLSSATTVMAGQSEYYSRGANGVLRMKHSPVLGINIPIAVWIDGREAGAFAKGHVYERELAPGHHMVYAARPGRLFDAWYGAVDIQPGQTHSFVVKCTPNRVVLDPVGYVN